MTDVLDWGYAFIHPPCCSCVDDVFSEEVAATERASKRRTWMMLFVTDSRDTQQKTSHTERHMIVHGREADCRKEQ